MVDRDGWGRSYLTVRGEINNAILIPEREPEKRLPYLRKTASAQFTRP